jgi:hypothetical protein
LKLFRDILKETDKTSNETKFSQGRVYLLIAIIAYYLTLGILVLAGMQKNNDVDLSKFRIVVDALEFALVLFGGYVLGGKIVDVFKILRPNSADSISK